MTDNLSFIPKSYKKFQNTQVGHEFFIPQETQNNYTVLWRNTFSGAIASFFNSFSFIKSLLENLQLYYCL